MTPATDYLVSLVEMLKETEPMERISDYIDGRRVMPLNSPIKGVWRNATAPYWVPVMDTLSPYSPIRETYVMAGAQTGKTANALEAPIAYYMDENPTTIMLVSATDDNLKDWSETRLEALIDSCGFRHKIAAQVENPKSRKSGDKTMSKQFFGGNLDMVSAQSPAGLRGKSRQILALDEIDGAPRMLKTGEGNFVAVATARVRAYGPRYKIVGVSTPTTVDESLIFPLFNEGDCNHLWVPCPKCGEFQELQDPLMTGDVEWGLKPARDDEGHVTEVVYVCRHCARGIEEHHKPEMMAAFQWRPTKRPDRRDVASFWLPAMYSPFGMYSWKSLFNELEKGRKNGDLRGFTNTVQGLPFAETGSRPDSTKWQHHLGNYPRATIPEGVLFTTIAVDVQRGSDKDARNPTRLEWHVVGHGDRFKTWSVAHGSFRGPVDDAYSGAWEDLHAARLAGAFVFTRLSDSKAFAPVRGFFDSGYQAAVTYTFCDRWPGWAFPVKGASQRELDAIPGKTEKPGVSSSRQYHWSRLSGDTMLCLVSTHLYKAYIYNRLKIPRGEYPQGGGFPDFPSDYDEEFFRSLMSEEKLADGSYKQVYDRNEMLDTTVYALAAADSWMDEMMNQEREYWRREYVAERRLPPPGMSREDALKTINRDYVVKKFTAFGGVSG